MSFAAILKLYHIVSYTFLLIRTHLYFAWFLYIFNKGVIYKRICIIYEYSFNIIGGTQPGICCLTY